MDDILSKLGLTPNKMQLAAFSAFASDDRNIVVLSPTGTGKTLAYMLPLIRAIDTDDDNLQAVVIVPGRELAEQSEQVLKLTGAGVRAMSLHGGRPTMDEHRQMRRIRPQIVFATPGRLNDHLDKQNIGTNRVKTIVIDEFDKCLEMGFDAEMTRIMERLPRGARRVLLSATDTDEIPHYLGQMDDEHVDVLNFLASEDKVTGRILFYSVKSPDKDKLETLKRLLLSLGSESTVVFLNYRESVERTAHWLAEQGFTVSLYHGGLDQKERERALYRFANGSANILVATDLASRGIDIPDITNVVHYHLPETETNYKHRTGRTARWDRKGRVFFILSPAEQIPQYISDKVEEFTPEPSADAKPPVPRMATLYIGKGKKDKISRGDIVGFLCKKCGLKGDEIGKVSVEDYYAFVAVSRQKMKQTIRAAAGQKIKGLKTVVEEIADSETVGQDSTDDSDE